MTLQWRPFLRGHKTDPRCRTFLTIGGNTPYDTRYRIRTRFENPEQLLDDLEVWAGRFKQAKRVTNEMPLQHV